MRAKGIGTEHIAVGIGDAGADAVLGWVVDRGRRRPIRIDLVRAFDPLVSDPTHDRNVLDRARARLEQALPRAEVVTFLETATVEDALVDASRAADLVVVGARSGRSVRSVLHGSAPLRIASRAPRATVIVPAGWAAGRAHGIVAGLGDDGTSDEAIRFAARQAAAEETDLAVVHAWTVPVRTIADVLVSEDAELQGAHRHDLDRAVADLRTAVPGLEVRGTLEEGPARDALADHARDARMVVIGSHRRDPLMRLILGSTARGVLTRTSTPICIVPPHTAAGAPLADNEVLADV